MKKYFLVFISLILCSVFLIVPCFALQNPTVFSPDHLNSDPKIFVFSPVGDTLSFYVPESTWYPYLVPSDLATRELSLYLMCLDDHFNLIDADPDGYPIYFNVGFYKPQTLAFTRSYQSQICHITINDLYSSTTCNLQFQCTASNVAYVCLIPLSTGIDDAYNDLIFDWNYRFNSTVGLPAGYEVGYQDGYSQGNLDGRAFSYNYGYSDGFNDGYSDGYQAGESDVITSDVKGTILYTVSAPFQAITNFLNFEVLGINLASLFAFLLTAVILVFILKHFI